MSQSHLIREQRIFKIKKLYTHISMDKKKKIRTILERIITFYQGKLIHLISISFRSTMSYFLFVCLLNILSKVIILFLQKYYSNYFFYFNFFAIYCSLFNFILSTYNIIFSILCLKKRVTRNIKNTPSVCHQESHLWAVRVLRNIKKSGWKKISGI